MTTRQTMLITGLAAFVSGFFAGLAFSSERGRQVRQQISEQAHHTSSWMEDRLHHLEGRLHDLEDRLQHAGEEFGARVREATDRATDHLVPQAPDDWDVENDEVTRELRRMPRP